MSQAVPETAAKMVARLADTHVGPDAITKAILHELEAVTCATCPSCRKVLGLLGETLPAFVRPRLHDARVKAARELEDAVVELEEDDEYPTQPTLDEPPAPPRVGEFVSRRVERRHYAYARLLLTNYKTASGYLRLGECCAEDLEYAAKIRRDQAAGHLFEAGRLERLAAAAREYGAARVDELPETVVTDIMRRDAA